MSRSVSFTWAARWWRPSRHREHDVVFYTPWIGSALSRQKLMPPGGAETQVLALAEALARRGIHVAIIAYGNADDLPAVLNGVTIVARPPYTKNRGGAGKLAEVARIWRSLHSVPSRAIVYRGAGVELGLIALYARLARRRVVFASASSADFNYRKVLDNERDRFFFRFGSRLASTIVVQTEEQIDPCRLVLRRQPTLIRSIAPLAESQQHTPEAFLWVGRLVEYKRPLDYLALAQLLPEARFWMVGVTVVHNEESRLVTEAVSGRAAAIANLRLLSPRPHRDLMTLMDRAVASVNTSEFEGMPNTLLEGWTRGIPSLVLTYDPGGVVERHGLGGFAHGSLDELVELARDQWMTRHARTDISTRCRAYVQEYHDPDVVAGQWRTILTAP